MGKSPAERGDLSKRDTLKHMDAFTWAILNVNCCQDGVCGWQQPLASCDREREKTERGRLRVGVGETYSTFSMYISINTYFETLLF